MPPREEQPPLPFPGAVLDAAVPEVTKRPLKSISPSMLLVPHRSQPVGRRRDRVPGINGTIPGDGEGAGLEGPEPPEPGSAPGRCTHRGDAVGRVQWGWIHPATGGTGGPGHRRRGEEMATGNGLEAKTLPPHHHPALLHPLFPILAALPPLCGQCQDGCQGAAGLWLRRSGDRRHRSTARMGPIRPSAGLEASRNLG